MIKAKHSIQLPDRLVAPGELLTLSEPGAEARLIALGVATAVAAPSDPSDPSDAPAPKAPPAGLSSNSLPIGPKAPKHK